MWRGATVCQLKMAIFAMNSMCAMEKGGRDPAVWRWSLPMGSVGAGSAAEGQEVVQAS